MKRVSSRLGGIALSVLGLALVSAWPARVSANGLNLSWDACGHAGLSSKTFACNTNVGEERLVLSGQFPMAGMLPELCYVADLDFSSGQATLPSWWSVNEVGACRSSAISMYRVPDGAGIGECQWTDPSFGIYSFVWTISGSSPTRRRLTITGIPAGGMSVGDYLDSAETYVGTLLISHVQTVGAGSCSGCATPVCIVFNSLQVLAPFPPHAPHRHIAPS